MMFQNVATLAHKLEDVFYIISFILGVGSAFWIDAVLTRNGKLQGKSAQIAGVFLLLAVSALFMLFTFYPPKIPWFLDEQSGIYGI